MDLRRLQYFVAACEERNLGRAAARLHMTQPPLTRAMASLEHDLGTRLLDRSASGVSPTPAGLVLYDEARALLRQAEHLRESVARASESRAITVGVLADVVDHLNRALLAHFRLTHPSVAIGVYEADLTDPTAGLRTRQADVAVTRSPLDDPGIQTLALGAEPVGVVVRGDDPVAELSLVRVESLSDRDWVCLPQSAGPTWNAYWSGTGLNQHHSRRAARTIQECLQSVLWDGAIALAPLGQSLPRGLSIVPVEDREPNRLLVAWRRGDAQPAVVSFVQTARTRRH